MNVSMAAEFAEILQYLYTISNVTATQPQKFSWTLETVLNTILLIMMLAMFVMKMRKRYDEAQKMIHTTADDVVSLKERVNKMMDVLEGGNKKSKEDLKNV